MINIRYVYRNEETSNNSRLPWLLIRLCALWCMVVVALVCCVLFLHVFHVWFLFCLYAVRFSTLLSVSLLLSGRTSAFDMWNIHRYMNQMLFVAVNSVKRLWEWVGVECVSVCALLYTCNKQRHQVFNIRNKNEATTNARICYVYRIYRFKRYMWQIYVSSTISVTRLTLPLLLCIAPFHSLVYVILHLFCLLFTLSLYRNWSLWAILSRDYHG